MQYVFHYSSCFQRYLEQTKTLVKRKKMAYQRDWIWRNIRCKSSLWIAPNRKCNLKHVYEIFIRFFSITRLGIGNAFHSASQLMLSLLCYTSVSPPYYFIFVIFEWMFVACMCASASIFRVASIANYILYMMALRSTRHNCHADNFIFGKNDVPCK